MEPEQEFNFDNVDGEEEEEEEAGLIEVGELKCYKVVFELPVWKTTYKGVTVVLYEGMWSTGPTLESALEGLSARLLKTNGVAEAEGFREAIRYINRENLGIH